MINVNIRDGNTKKGLTINQDSSALVSQKWPAIPKLGSASILQFFSQRVSSDGVGGGVTNMNVDGSVNPQFFTLAASKDFDIRIMKLMIFIEDTMVTHAGFGNLAALTNGVDISVIESKTETFLIEKAKKFADLIEQTVMDAPFGETATAFELQSTTGVQDAQALPMDIGALIPNGIRIGTGTQDKLQVIVRDDLTGLTQFTVRVLGYKHFPI